MYIDDEFELSKRKWDYFWYDWDSDSDDDSDDDDDDDDYYDSDDDDSDDSDDDDDWWDFWDPPKITVKKQFAVGAHSIKMYGIQRYNSGKVNIEFARDFEAKKTLDESPAYLHEHKCIPTCPDGMTPKYGYGTCITCHESCYICISETSKSCLTCQGGKFLDIHECLDKCPEDKLVQGIKCVEQCEDQYYKVDSDCKPCQKFCKQCVNDKYCIRCIHGHYLFEESCEEECRSGYFAFEDTCIKCHKSCMNCTDMHASNCTACDESKHYLFKNTCYTKCNDGEFLTV